VGWWLIRGEEAEGPLALGELREAWRRGTFGTADWLCLGAQGLRHRPETIAQILRGADYPKWRLIEDWTDFRNLFRLAIVALLPLLALVAMMLYWMWYWRPR
jgi:hypothetical protein